MTENTSTNAKNPSRIITIARTSESVSWREFLKTIMSDAQLPQEDNKRIATFDNLVVDPRIELLLEEALPKFSIRNKFDTPIKDFLGGKGKSKTSEVLSTVTKYASLGTNLFNATKDGITGSLSSGGTSSVWNPWMSNVKSWESAEGLAFSYTFHFAMGAFGLWNAEEEVVKPILSLFAPAMPRYVSDFTMKGPLPHAVNMIANILESSAEFVKKGNILENLGSSIQSILLDAYKNFTYTVSFGNMMTFYKCIITGGGFSFSNKTDEDGYPISGEITLDFETMIPPAVTAKDTAIRAIKFGGV